MRTSLSPLTRPCLPSPKSRMSRLLHSPISPRVCLSKSDLLPRGETMVASLRLRVALIAIGLLLGASAPAQVLDKKKLLDDQTFWDNRDWDWYKANIPFFECPDRDI